MTPVERNLLSRLEVLDSVPWLRRRGNTANRTRYISELHRKLESGHKSQAELVAEAEATMAAHREEARQALHNPRPAPTPRPPGQFDMMARQAEADAKKHRERQEARQWGVQAAARERRRQQRAANPPADGMRGIGHERALEHIARHNNG